MASPVKHHHEVLKLVGHQKELIKNINDSLDQYCNYVCASPLVHDLPKDLVALHHIDNFKMYQKKLGEIIEEGSLNMVFASELRKKSEALDMLQEKLDAKEKSLAASETVLAESETVLAEHKSLCDSSLANMETAFGQARDVRKKLNAIMAKIGKVDSIPAKDLSKACSADVRAAELEAIVQTPATTYKQQAGEVELTASKMCSFASGLALSDFGCAIAELNNEILPQWDELGGSMIGLKSIVVSLSNVLESLEVIKTCCEFFMGKPDVADTKRQSEHRQLLSKLKPFEAIFRTMLEFVRARLEVIVDATESNREVNMSLDPSTPEQLDSVTPLQSGSTKEHVASLAASLAKLLEITPRDPPREMPMGPTSSSGPLHRHTNCDDDQSSVDNKERSLHDDVEFRNWAKSLSPDDLRGMIGLPPYWPAAKVEAFDTAFFEVIGANGPDFDPEPVVYALDLMAANRKA